MFKLINSLSQLLATLIVANAIFFGYKADAETINWVNVPIGEFVIPRYEAISGKRLIIDDPDTDPSTIRRFPLIAS
jgi:hypothetical protein